MVAGHPRTPTASPTALPSSSRPRTSDAAPSSASLLDGLLHSPETALKQLDAVASALLRVQLELKPGREAHTRRSLVKISGALMDALVALGRPPDGSSETFDAAMRSVAEIQNLQGAGLKPLAGALGKVSGEVDALRNSLRCELPVEAAAGTLKNAVTFLENGRLSVSPPHSEVHFSAAQALLTSLAASPLFLQPGLENERKLLEDATLEMAGSAGTVASTRGESHTDRLALFKGQLDGLLKRLEEATRTQKRVSADKRGDGFELAPAPAVPPRPRDAEQFVSAVARARDNALWQVTEHSRSEDRAAASLEEWKRWKKTEPHRARVLYDEIKAGQMAGHDAARQVLELTERVSLDAPTRWIELARIPDVRWRKRCTLVAVDGELKIKQENRRGDVKRFLPIDDHTLLFGVDLEQVLAEMRSVLQCTRAGAPLDRLQRIGQRVPFESPDTARMFRAAIQGSRVTRDGAGALALEMLALAKVQIPERFDGFSRRLVEQLRGTFEYPKHEDRPLVERLLALEGMTWEPGARELLEDALAVLDDERLQYRNPELPPSSGEELLRWACSQL